MGAIRGAICEGMLIILLARSLFQPVWLPLICNTGKGIFLLEGCAAFCPVKCQPLSIVFFSSVICFLPVWTWKEENFFNTWQATEDSENGILNSQETQYDNLVGRWMYTMNCKTEDDEGISPRGSSLNHLGRVALALKTSLTSVDAGIGKGDS